jgi:hypothetical protein
MLLWADLPDEKLLDLRLCDLNLKIEGTILEESIEHLFRELEHRGLRFRPHYWLSDEWFTPDGVPGSALAFYMAHPRLMELEGEQMLEVEGGTSEWCLRILRHEAGHSVDNAYRLRRKRRRQRLFGKSSLPYPAYYSPKPYSRSYVVHLDSWYAQSHPDEDFAETFAVWLAPNSQWERKYAIWPALKKLQYMDELMQEVAGQKPPVTTRRRVAHLAGLDKTLREHYRIKRELHNVDFPKTYDRDLQRLFSSSPECLRNTSAAAFLSRVRTQVRRSVARRTGVYQYTIDRVIEDMISRCRHYDLRRRGATEETKLEFAILLTAHTMDYLHSGRYRCAL